MRTILHAKFGDELAKLPSAPDKVPRTSPGPQLVNAQAAWRASRGPTRTVTRSSRIASFVKRDT